MQLQVNLIPARSKAEIRRSRKAGQFFLFDDERVDAATRSERARLELVVHLYDLCRKHKMGVSLREHGYLRTLQPRSSMNFWFYTPQHKMDKAPTRKRPTTQ